MSRITRTAALLLALVFSFTTLATAPVSAQTAPSGSAGTVSGVIVDRDGGTYLAGANLVLFHGDGKKVVETKTDRNGAFTFVAPSAGIYYVQISATGYQTVRTDDLQVAPGLNATVRATIERAQTSSTNNIREIGRVGVTRTGSGGVLATSTTINQQISSGLVQKEGYVRIGDALGTLPGVNLTGLSSSVGDGLGIDIRGFGSSETETLLDGHPIGPQGASGNNTFDFQVSPSYAIANTVVTYGSGALGLYGTDSIGGTVDLQTLNPTPQNHLQVSQGVGYEGRRFTALQATGTAGKLGFALAHAVDGTYGPYKLQNRAQPGLFTATNAGNFSPANESLPANYYATGSDYELHNDLLKVKYQFSNATSLQLDTTSAQSFSDKTGNGDNCYFTYGYQLNNALQNSSAPAPYTVSLTNGNSVTVNCPAGQLGVTFNDVSAQCISAAQYAQNSYGLVGGGVGPFQTHRFNDYHGRIQTALGNNVFTIDGFGNRYSTDYNRNAIGQQFRTDFFDTTGLLLSDDIQTTNNEFGFGYFVDHQNHTGTFLNLTGKTPVFQIGVPSTPGLSLALGERNFFVRDQYTPPGPFSAYLNAWLKRSSVTQKQTLDPRLSLLYHVTSQDVVRLTGGRSDGAPAPDNVNGPLSLNQSPANLTPICGGQTRVGSSANPALQPESSIDYELGYGHRFAGDNVVNVDGYFSFEKNRIFRGVVPASSVPGVIIPASLLSQYFSRIAGFCGTPLSSLSYANLAYTAPFNAANTRYQGVEISGRYRLNPRLFLDYTYDTQSAVDLGLPDSLLKSNPTLIPGKQIQGVQLHKASAGLDYQSLQGFEARVDSYYVGEYNSYNRLPFFYANATLSQRAGRGTTLNVGVLNLFNSNVSTFNSTGDTPFIAENRFGTDQNATQQNANLGIQNSALLPITAVFSITQRI